MKTNIKNKLKQIDEDLDLFFSIPQIQEPIIVFGFASICTFILIICGSQINMTGFALFGVVIFWLIWAEIRIYYAKKRKK